LVRRSVTVLGVHDGHDSGAALIRDGKVLAALQEEKLNDYLLNARSAPYMISGFGELSRFAGLTFEEFVRRFLTASLRRAGEIPEDTELRSVVVDGEEVDVFLEDPLIIGEVTAHAENVDEVRKLLRKAEVVRAKYGREPRKLLVILMVRSEALKDLRRMAEEKGVELIIGKTV